MVEPLNSTLFQFTFDGDQRPALVDAEVLSACPGLQLASVFGNPHLEALRTTTQHVHSRTALHANESKSPKALKVGLGNDNFLR